MDTITVEAKTFDEAMTKAMMELGTSSDNIDYEIIEKGTSGFLGLFGKKVVIRARKKKEDDLDEQYAAVVEGRDIPKKKGAKEPAKETGKKPAKKQAEPVKEIEKEPGRESAKKQAEPAREPGKEPERESAKKQAEPVKEVEKEPGRESAKKQAEPAREPAKETEKEPLREIKKEEKKDNHKEIKTEFKTESKYEVKSLKGKDLPRANRNSEKKGPRNIMKETKPQPQAPSREKSRPSRESYRERDSYRERESYRGRDSYRDEESYREEEIRAEREREERERLERERRERESRKPVNVEACETAARAFLTQVLSAMNMEVTLTVEYNEEEREMTINLSGDDMGILIGKRGQTLDSLQYLTSLVVNKQTEGYLRVKLDTENYRSRRKATLEELARNIAYKVKRTRRSVSLEPMNPYERRIIHSALQNNKYVVTRSEGEDPYRHVVVSLKREYGKERRPKYHDHSEGTDSGTDFSPAAETPNPAEETVQGPSEKPEETAAE